MTTLPISVSPAGEFVVDVTTRTPGAIAEVVVLAAVFLHILTLTSVGLINEQPSQTGVERVMATTLAGDLLPAGRIHCPFWISGTPRS
jgi:hypothetical protein